MLSFLLLSVFIKRFHFSSEKDGEEPGDFGPDARSFGLASQDLSRTGRRLL